MFRLPAAPEPERPELTRAQRIGEFAISSSRETAGFEVFHSVFYSPIACWQPIVDRFLPTDRSLVPATPSVRPAVRPPPAAVKFWTARVATLSHHRDTAVALSATVSGAVRTGTSPDETAGGRKVSRRPAPRGGPQQRTRLVNPLDVFFLLRRTWVSLRGDPLAAFILPPSDNNARAIFVKMFRCRSLIRYRIRCARGIYVVLEFSSENETRP